MTNSLKPMRLTNPKEDQVKFKKNKITFNPVSGELVVPVETAPGKTKEVSVNTL